MLILSCDQVRNIDAVAINKFHIPGIVLMENAGRGATQQLIHAGVTGPVVVLCGKGNNAGDGLVVARHLDILGIDVHLICLAGGHELRGDAAINYQIATASGLKLDHVTTHDALDALVEEPEWIVDGLLGTGAQGPPHGRYGDAIRWANRQPCRRMALDIPSGLHGDTGRAYDPTFVADLTCTFVAAKPGLLSPHARDFVGELQVIEIGVPRKLIAELPSP